MCTYFKILFTFLFFVNISCAHSESVNDQYSKLEKSLSIISEYEKGMGKLLILEKGKVAFEKTFGFKQMPNDPIFRLGSISKTYTAVIISRLVEEGVLKFEDKVSAFYPEIPNSKKITLEHLLRHRSGLVNFTNLKDYPSYAETFSSENDHIKRMIKNGTQFKPGEKKSYSNTGYVLLTLIARKSSGKTFSELLSKFITGPLGLKDTFVFDSQSPRAREVLSYSKVRHWNVSTNTHETVPLGAGAIAASAKDLSLFIYALFKEKIVKKKTLKYMNKMVDNYGYGLFTVPYGKKVGVGHTGRIDDFYSIATYFKDSDTVFVQLLNAAVMDANEILIPMLASYYKDPFKLPEFKKIIKVPEEILVKYVGTFKAPDFPLEIKLFLKDKEFFAQAQGQPAFPLEAYSHTHFEFPPAHIKITFSDSKDSFELFQGKKFTFKRVMISEGNKL